MKHWRAWRTWILASAVAAPLAMLLHEIVHLLAFSAYGFPHPILHYGQASFEGADAFWRFLRLGDFESAQKIVRPGQAAVAAAVAPIFTYVTILAACAVASIRPGPFVIAFGVTSNLRVVPGVVVLLLTLLGGSASTSDDEQHVALLTATPELALILIGLTVMIVSITWLVQHLPVGQRVVALLGMVIGTIAGLAIYTLILGPMVLP
jgi:hypothetical protein